LLLLRSPLREGAPPPAGRGEARAGRGEARAGRGEARARVRGATAEPGPWMGPNEPGHRAGFVPGAQTSGGTVPVAYMGPEATPRPAAALPPAAQEPLGPQGQVLDQLGGGND